MTLIIRFNNTIQTDYLAGGFQYKDSYLKFFPHPEGYVNVIDDKYNYVFNYTDHLGNIRVSYGVDPSTSTLKILEENHYYPFGLKHEGYNMDYKMYQKIQSGAIVIRVAAPLQPNYTYKFQGQERQDELGLNWDSFKWRNYDFAIARFMNIDPLTEEYNTWSPYTFSGNRVVDARELEGLEPYVLYNTQEEAENNYAEQYNGMSIRSGNEIGAKKYSLDGKYGYTTPYLGGKGGVDINSSGALPENAEFIGGIHSHGNDRNMNVVIKGKVVENTDNQPSPQDIEKSKEHAKNPSYEHDTVITPNGSKFNYGPSDKDTNSLKPTKVGHSLPSDPNSTTRRGSVSPNITPIVLPLNVKVDDYPHIPEPKKDN